MQDPEALHKVERHLRSVFDPSGEFEEAAGLFADLREGGAQVVYPCGTHADPVACEVANIREFLDTYNIGELIPDNSIAEYVKEHGHHRECHS